MLLPSNSILLTGETVQEILHNEEFLYTIITTCDGERYTIIMTNDLVSLLTHSYDLTRVDVVDLEDHNGVTLPFKLYRKRAQHIVYAMSA